MLRRSLGGVLWALVGVLTLLLAAPATLVNTQAGRTLLARLIMVVGEGALAGRVEVRGVTGGLYTSLILSDVRLYDRDTTLVAWLPQAELHFSLLDFAAGRVVLDGVSLERPYINLVQHCSGRLNFEELLRLREPAPPGPPPARSQRPALPPLILFRNVRIRDGDIVLRLQQHDAVPAGSALEIDPYGPDGPHRIRRFEGLNADIAVLRIQSPREHGILVSLRRLAVRSTDPPVEVTGAEGRVLVDGDSLQTDLRALRLPRSLAAVKGQVSWPRDTIRYNLNVAADRVTLGDARFIDRRFPDDAVLRGPVRVHSRSGRSLEVRLDSLLLLYHGGRVQGRVTALTDADSGIVRLEQADLDARDLDLALPRVFLDTLPFYGHLTGRTQADGGMSALALTADWVFRDSLVTGWPTSRLRGHGTVDLRAAAGLSFVDFSVDSADLDMGTVHRLAPTIALGGRTEWQGTLNGPLRDVEFAGGVRHRDRGLSSVARGRLGLDTRRDTLALNVDFSFDTLSFDDLRFSYPGLPVLGAAAGTVRLLGPVDSLESHIDLVHAAGGGRIRGDGALVLLPNRVGVRDYRLQGSGVDLRRWAVRGGELPTGLNFTVTGSLVADSGVGAVPVGALAGSLEPSVFVGAVVDTVSIRVRVADGIVSVDTVLLRRPGLDVDGAGTLRWRRPPGGDGTADALSLRVVADSLIGLDSLYALLAGDTTRRTPSGAGQGTATLSGALDSVAVAAEAVVRSFAFRDWSVLGGVVRGSYAPGPLPVFSVSAQADSVGHGNLGFGGAAVAAGGNRDSVDFSLRTRIGDLSAVFATGRYRRMGNGFLARADSFGVLMPGGVWYLERPAELAVGDSGIVLRDVALRRVNGVGQFDLSATLPNRGPVQGRLTARELPVAGLLAVVQLDTLGIGGRLGAAVALTGTRDQPEFRGTYEVAYDSSAESGPVPSIAGSLGYAEGWLDGSLALRRRGRAVIDATAHLPLDLALRPVDHRLRADTLVVLAKADHADLGALQVLTSNVEQLRGSFSADVGIRGAWDAPRLHGRFQLDSGGVTIPSLNVRYEDIDGRFSLGGDTLSVDSLAIRSGRGLVNVGGFVRFADLSHPVLGLTLAARDFRALDVRNEMAVTATAELRLTGPLLGATITGRGTVTSGLLYFGDLVTKRIINLDSPDPWIASLIDTALAATIRRGRLGPTLHNLFLDSLRVENLHLSMGSDVWLRSSEANIQLAGDITMNKSQQNYLLSGTLQATRGSYRLLVGPISRDFLVTRGTVRFFGTPDLDAGLDIQARHVVRTRSNSAIAGDTLTVQAQITGTLLVPKLALRAVERDLSQTDIISYLLFSQSNADLASDPSASASSSAMVSNTVASLVSGELERTLVSDIGVPIDYVEIRPGDPNNPLHGARFTAGWQVSEKAFLVLKAGVCPGAQTSVVNTIGWGLQYRISPEWGTEASIEPVTSCTTPGAAPTVQTTERQVGFDLFWQRRF